MDRGGTPEDFCNQLPPLPAVLCTYTTQGKECSPTSPLPGLVIKSQVLSHMHSCFLLLRSLSGCCVPVVAAVLAVYLYSEVDGSFLKKKTKTTTTMDCLYSVQSASDSLTLTYSPILPPPPTHTHSLTHTNEYKRTHASTHAHTLAHTHTYTHSLTHTHVRTSAHSRTHTHTLTHTH